MADFQERFEYLLATRHVQQKAIVDAAGITRQALHNYLTGQRTPRLDQLIALADFFDVSLDYLVGRSDDPARHP